MISALQQLSPQTDIEGALQTYVVRRRPFGDDDARNHGKIYDNIPLLMCELKAFVTSAGSDSSRFFRVFDGRVQFRKCLVYGRIVNGPIKYRTVYKYWLDDGSAVFPILVSRHESEERALQNELLLVQHNAPDYEGRLAVAVKNLIASSLERLPTKALALGTRVLVSVKPHRFHREWVLSVIRLHCDEPKSSNLEIAFNDWLRDWYDKDYTKKS